jgi:ribosomal protein L11
MLILQLRDFKGTKVPVEIDVDTKTKTYKIKVFSPPVAELIKKELGLERDQALQEA